MNSIRYVFSREFSKLPGGRKRASGPRSGEEFRDDHLEPLLKKYDHVELILDGAVGFPVSFLDEVFSVLRERYGADFLRKHLKVVCDDDPMVLGFIHERISE